MKKYIVLFIIIFSAFNSYSQLEVLGRYTVGGTIEPDINIYGEKKISTKVNLAYFALIEQSWSEALIGILYSPKAWISYGLMVGIEQNPALYRFLGTLWLGKGKTSLLILVEKGNGTDNYWYKNTLSYNATDKFTLGLRAWRFNGVGPVGTLKVKKLSSSVWIMPAYDFEVDKKRISLGVSINLK